MFPLPPYIVDVTVHNDRFSDYSVIVVRNITDFKSVYMMIIYDFFRSLMLMMILTRSLNRQLTVQFYKKFSSNFIVLEVIYLFESDLCYIKDHQHKSIS